MYNLLEHEGLCVGSSSAINVAGAMRVAKALGPGHTIVTVLCDYGTRYQHLFQAVCIGSDCLLPRSPLTVMLLAFTIRRFCEVAICPFPRGSMTRPNRRTPLCSQR
jgi:hypothetical protein